ncbi:hypothetical protein AAVH_20486 [Aphelenchoides avenae]|nr:hypothetical protein AAVH_20486 [Aphelenchus avenae]
MDANACGGDGLLSGHPIHLTTDIRSPTAKATIDDRTLGYGPGTMPGLPATSRKCGPWAGEKASLPPSTGHCSDADTQPSSDELDDDDPRFAPNDNILQDYSGYAVSSTSPADKTAVLLKCLQTTAVNISQGYSRSVIVFFDSGSTCTYISVKLARELQLPCLEKRSLRVHTFGTEATTTIAGFATTALLRSPQGHTVAFAATASDRMVPPVTTALISEDDVAMLKKNRCSLISSREAPDLLIGQDLMELFDRQLGPKLPNKFRVVRFILGPMTGGAGKVAQVGKATTSTHAAVDLDPTRLRAHEYNPKDPLNLWTLGDDPEPMLALNAGPTSAAPAMSPAHNAGYGRDEPTVVDATTSMCALIENHDADLFEGFSQIGTGDIDARDMKPHPAELRHPLLHAWNLLLDGHRHSGFDYGRRGRNEIH